MMGNIQIVIQPMSGNATFIDNTGMTVAEANFNILKINIHPDVNHEEATLIRERAAELATQWQQTDILLTKDELWQWQAPSFNFELGKDELLAKALEVGFVSKAGENQYLLNKEY